MYMTRVWVTGVCHRSLFNVYRKRVRAHVL